MTTRVFAGVALVALAASPALAQTSQGRPERPYRGLFGGGYGNTEQLLQVTASLAGGYDTNVLAGANGNEIGTGTPGLVGSGAASANQLTGPYADGMFGLEYTVNRKRIGFGSTASTSQRYYTSDAASGLMGSYGGGLSGWFQLAKHTNLTLNETLTYQPFLSYGFQPVPVVPQPDEVFIPDVGPAFETALLHVTQVRNDFMAGLTQSLSARTSVAFHAGYDSNRTDVSSLNLSYYNLDGRFTWSFAKGLGIHAGYGYREGRYGDAQSDFRAPVVRNIDVGFDYNRPLSFSRRTTLQLSSGSTAYDDPAGTRYWVTANANLNYEFNRTWNASLRYARDMQFVEYLRAPAFTDSLSFNVHGLLSRRFELSTIARASLGTVGTLGSSDYSSYFGSVALTTGLNRYVGVTTTYSYFRYQYDRAVFLPQSMQPDRGRQSVQASLNLRLPLMSRSRRPDAAR